MSAMRILENWWPKALAGDPKALEIAIRCLDELKILHGTAGR